MEKGYIHLYTGDGKGKTTAALGLCLRCASRGLRVGFTSFLKDFTSAELSSPSFYVFYGRPMKGFYPQLTDVEKEAVKVEAENRLRRIFETCENEQYDLLVLDEIVPAISLGCVSEQLVLELLQGKSEGLEVVLTGRDAAKSLYEIADYVSEIRAVKHPYDKGVVARAGIEY